MEFSGQDVEKALCCDAVLNTIRWASDGRDLELSFELGNGQHGLLLCTWIDNLHIHIKSGEKNSGILMAWQVSVESARLSDRWHLLIDFTDNQKLSVECETLMLGTNDVRS